MRLIVMAALAAMTSAAALAQGSPAVAACAVMDARLPAGLGGWAAETAITTATTNADTAKADLAIGKGYRASLLNTPKVTFAVQPEKPGGSVSFSGLFAFTVETEGVYTVALGSAAWIDVVEGGKLLQPVSFGHGPECTTIRKMVTFTLKPGSHLLQIAGNGAESVKLLVAKQP